MPHAKKEMVSFFLTTRCNLCCEYCYNREERSKIVEQSLPIEIAKAGLDWFFKRYQSRHIRFYGPGEPTQEIELMKEIVSYARQQAGSEVSVELQTNGVFLPKDREWLLNNINIMWISFDGEPFVHDAQRHFPNGSPTSPFIEKNVKWIMENRTNQNLMVGVRVTITDENVDRQKQMVDYFKSLGIEYIWSDPMIPSVGVIPSCYDKSKMASFHFDMDKYVDEYIEAKRYADSIGMFYGSFLTCNFDGTCKSHCRACIPVPHFTPDGYISACDLVTFGKDAGHMDCFVYGKWNDNEHMFSIDDNKVHALQERTIDHMKHCNSCKVREHCGGYCLGEVQNETGELTGQKVHVCKAINRLAENIGFSDVPYLFMHP